MSDTTATPAATKLWMVRAGGDGWYASHFLDDYVISCSWSFAQPADAFATAKDLQAAMVEADPSQKHVQTSKQLFTFANTLKPGDGVVTLEPASKTYHLGTITGGYRYRPDWLPEASDRLPHTRMVVWEHEIAKDALSKEVGNVLMRPMTIFAVRPDAAGELLSQVNG